MTEWLSAEWVDASSEIVGTRVRVPGLSATVEVVIKEKSKEVGRYHRAFSESQLVESASGAATAPDVSFTATPDDARAMLSGELDPSVAFMSGRLKTAGDNGLVLQVLAAWSSPEGRAATTAVAAMTDLA